jgi:hypothetical protein
VSFDEIRQGRFANAIFSTLRYGPHSVESPHSPPEVPVSIRAIAFHENLAVEKLEDLLTSPESQALAETQALTCSKCNLGFVAVLVAKGHPGNAEYLARLNTMIEEDCINRMHQGEYVVDEEG